MDNTARGKAPVSAPAGILFPEGLLEIGCEAHRTDHLSGPTGGYTEGEINDQDQRVGLGCPKINRQAYFAQDGRDGMSLNIAPIFRCSIRRIVQRSDQSTANISPLLCLPAMQVVHTLI